MLGFDDFDPRNPSGGAVVSGKRIPGDHLVNKRVFSAELTYNAGQYPI
jgi:hypothetical protein